jgi:hypothetical protein
MTPLLAITPDETILKYVTLICCIAIFVLLMMKQNESPAK